jgi:hypothetical protein
MHVQLMQRKRHDNKSLHPYQKGLVLQRRLALLLHACSNLQSWPLQALLHKKRGGAIQDL